VSDKLSLYELSAEAVALDELTYLEAGEWTPEIEALHGELMKKMLDKSDNTGAFIKTLEARALVAKAEADARDAEAARYRARQKANENAVKRAKAYAVMAMLNMGRPKLQGERFTLAVQGNSTPSVKTPDFVDALPPEFVRVTVTKEADKDAITRAIKGGREIPGCSLEYGHHLRIR
jgi:hypothetical protein